jgi:GT2 family glycosyltransferase
MVTKKCEESVAPSISVIIPSGRPNLVLETVEALEKQELAGTAVQVIVVSAEASSLEKNLGPQVVVVEVERLHAPGKMRNIGAAAASGMYLAFIDDDCLPPSQWLHTQLQVLRDDEQCGMVGCRLTARDENFWARCADYSLFWAYQQHKRIQTPLGSAAIAVRTHAFKQVGGFDENLLASEDWDFSLKLLARGWTCWFDPRVEVAHNHGCDTFGKILQKAYRYGQRSRLAVQERHKGQMSILARISLRFGSPWLYWLNIVPLSLIVCTAQFINFWGDEKRISLYFPFMVISRMAYHCGVLHGLINERKCS